MQAPAEAIYWFIPGRVLFSIIPVVGAACFAWIVWRRLVPLLRAQRDLRFNRPIARLRMVLQYWLGQWRHPRYIGAGILHILLFSGFCVLAMRAFTLLMLGVNDRFVMPGLSGRPGQVYTVVTDYAATIVLAVVIVAAARRIVFRPARYSVPARYGIGWAIDAVFLLALIGVLMLADSLFEGTAAAARAQQGLASESNSPLSLPWIFATLLASASRSTLSTLHLGAHFVHELTFFFLLCYRPFGIQFHVETSLFSIFFAKLDRARLKPVRWGIADEQLDQVKSFGVKTFDDFTWKHILDFYSCADCGRCAEQCPSNTVGRPLSPRFLSFKGREYAFRHYRMFGKPEDGQPLVPDVYSDDEVWSCTTCGACEAECPLLVENIDKIVDLRRGLVDAGRVPQSLQKPLKAIESRGNPYGKLERKRADWAKDPAFLKSCAVKVVNGNGAARTLYFVDSITAYDDRIQAIGRATASVLTRVGEDFGILGPAEKDSGHDVRRFGEETLFMALRAHNTDAIKRSGAQRIVTNDPHAYNALKHDYRGVPPVEHVSEFMARAVRAGKLALKPVISDDVHVYHDPCYLGRHNGVYDAPREVLDSIPGLKRVEMKRSRDRSFCCGGGGLALFYEPREDERMGVVRVRMAAEAGANVIVTACPFCMVNIEDAIKVAGMEGRMTAIDLTELVVSRL